VSGVLRIRVLSRFKTKFNTLVDISNSKTKFRKRKVSRAQALNTQRREYFISYTQSFHDRMSCYAPRGI
jgi:hypothetical protein